MVAVFDSRSFQRRNALGSVMEITDMNEAEVVSCRYAPYAPVTITVSGTPQSSDQLGNPWTYTGRFHDEETGLYYDRARSYSPVTGRFLERDPIGSFRNERLYEYPPAARREEGRGGGRERPVGAGRARCRHTRAQGVDWAPCSEA